MKTENFPRIFEALTGVPPFPWQTALYQRFIDGDFPKSANIPTGLGKTSTVAVWLIALAQHPGRVPRRLVYVVNRRTVVDQTTTEVQRLRDALTNPELAEIRNALASLCALPLPTPEALPLAISTLRGLFADNGEWSVDPSRPAVVVGTVDMIGSGLLFSRYTRGFKTRPLHAGFLAQDVLLVHDEAHLEAAFQTLLESIVAEQKVDGDLRTLCVIALTATTRASMADANARPFGLDENPNDKDSDNETVQKRVNAVKRLSLVALGNGEKLDAKLVALAKEKIDGRAILIFTRSVETAMKVADELDKGENKGKVATLTGTMRGKERDELVSTNPVFQRFLPEKDRAKNTEITGTVYLVATSAGEVGVNISADDLICDLSTYESMAQRFGRVNRFGACSDSTIIVVHEAEFGKRDKQGKLVQDAHEIARERTLSLLRKLDGTACPAALDALPATARAAAFSPPPALRIATEIQFDAWALTSIRDPIAARPPVAPYLHGETELQLLETHLAWRDDRDFQHIEDPEAFLDDFPLKPVELLRDATARIVRTLSSMLEKRAANTPPVPDAWLVSENGSVSRFPLSDFDKDAAVTSLADATLILPACLGGLDANGLFSASAKSPTSDCSGIERSESVTRGTDAAYSREVSDENADEPRFILWFAPEPSRSTAVHGGNRALETLAAHTDAVAANATAIAAKFFSDPPTAGEPDLGRCLVRAAHLHDLGKNRSQWQRNIGNLSYDPAKPGTIFAKSGGQMRPRNVAEHYRHEFGSLLDSVHHADFNDLSEAEREIILHLVAAHHGRARPHFPANEIFDYAGNIAVPVVAAETLRRFARLQKRFGRWGLAWLESLLRAADYAASAGIVAQSSLAASARAATPSQTGESPNRPQPKPTATLAVNPANPGHYFACCGLFELAARLAPDALAWFELVTTGFRFHLANTPSLAELLEKITVAEISAENDEPEDEEDADDETDENESAKEASAPPLCIGDPFNLRLDWWITALPGTSALKVWAGSMKVLRIAISMKQTVHEVVKASPTDVENILFDTRVSLDPFKIKKAEEKSTVQYDGDLKAAHEKRDEALNKAVAEKAGDKLEKEKARIESKYSEACAKAAKKRADNVARARAKAKTEPFYFDANRGPNSDARDIGFSPNDLKLKTLAAPASEFLTLAGLQRAIPQPSGDRLFDYHLWQTPVPIALLAAAINGFTEPSPQQSFRFESWYRTSQRKHKAFLPAKPL